MTPSFPCPLGDQHCAALDKSLDQLAQARQIAQDCVDCGLPFHDQLQEIKAREQLASNLKAKFFPHRI